MKNLEYQCSVKSVQADLGYQKSLREMYKQQLHMFDRYKNNKLVRTSVRGYPYFFLRESKPVTSARTYLGNEEHPMVSKLLQRDYYEAALRDVEENIKWLEKLLQHYQSPDPNLRLMSLEKKHHLKNKSRIFGSHFYSDAGVIDVHAWAAAEYPRSRKHPEHLVHRTMRGEYVRSKSEVIIANALYQAGIPYRYEQITEFAGIVIAADFIVLSVRHHKLFVWEHFGRMKDPQYQKDYLWKLRQYTKAGLVVGLDLLTTFDDVDGAIDTVTVRRYIEEVIL